MKKAIHASEMLFALAGVFILVSTLVIYFTQDFTLWNTAKVFYGAALLLVLKHT